MGCRLGAEEPCLASLEAVTDWLSRALPGVHKLGLAFGYFLFILFNISLKYQ